MSPATTKRKSPPKKASTPRSRKKKSRNWWQWWPVLAGIVLAPFAVRALDILTLTGRWPAWLLMPWTFLLQGHTFHMSEAVANHIVEGVMYAQFPLYGLMLILLMRRFRVGTSVGIIVAIHLLGFAAQAAVATS